MDKQDRTVSSESCVRDRLTYACEMPNGNNADTQVTGRPVRTRRRAAEVEAAVSDAVIAELAEVGFGRLTFDAVAERAGTGKSPLYRRWPDTTSLVIDVLDRLRVDPDEYKRTGILRDDLIGLARYAISRQYGIKGDAFRSLLGEAHRYPQLLERFKSTVFAPPFDALTGILYDAAERGDVSAERLTPVVLEVLHALLVKRLILETRRITKKDITEMVDQVLLPLVVG